MSRLLIGLVALLLTLVLALGAGVMMLGGGGLLPSQRALDEIPDDLIGLYESAASTCKGMSWTLLAAVHKTETSFGRGPVSSSAGAQGPMQFMPETFASYGRDGDGDGVARVDDLEDAIYSAANYLCANGAGDPARLRAAVWNYNHDTSYVDEVVALSSSYGVSAPVVGGAYAQGSLQTVLDDPRIVLTELARSDIEAGMIDQRVLAVMETLSSRFDLSVSVLKSGHSPYVKDTTSYSNHYFGRAVDIYAVNGQLVSSFNAASRELTMWLGQFPVEMRPSEVGSPFGDIVYPGAFSDIYHRDHVHIGFD